MIGREYQGSRSWELSEETDLGSRIDQPVYPVPQNAPHVSAGMNVLNFPKGQCPKAADVSLWYGVYLQRRGRALRGISEGQA